MRAAFCAAVALLCAAGCRGHGGSSENASEESAAEQTSGETWEDLRTDYALRAIPTARSNTRGAVAGHVLEEAPEVEYPVGETFGGAVELVGFDVRGELRRGNAVEFVWYWRLHDELDGDWEFRRTFARSADDDSTRVHIELGSAPLDGQFPVRDWPQGRVVREIQRTTLSGFLPDGGLQPQISISRPDRSVRHRQLDETGATDADDGPAMSEGGSPDLLKTSSGERIWRGPTLETAPGPPLRHVPVFPRGAWQLDGRLLEAGWSVPDDRAHALLGHPRLEAYATDRWLRIGSSFDADLSPAASCRALAFEPAPSDSTYVLLLGESAGAALFERTDGGDLRRLEDAGVRAKFASETEDGEREAEVQVPFDALPDVDEPPSTGDDWVGRTVDPRDSVAPGPNRCSADTLSEALDESTEPVTMRFFEPPTQPTPPVEPDAQQERPEDLTAPRQQRPQFCRKRRDMDADGTPDSVTRAFYRNGRRQREVRREWHDGGPGLKLTEIQWEYEEGRRKRAERDHNGDGEVDTVWKWRYDDRGRIVELRIGREDRSERPDTLVQWSYRGDSESPFRRRQKDGEYVAVIQYSFDDEDRVRQKQTSTKFGESDSDTGRFESVTEYDYLRGHRVAARTFETPPNSRENDTPDEIKRWTHHRGEWTWQGTFRPEERVPYAVDEQEVDAEGRVVAHRWDHWTIDRNLERADGRPEFEVTYEYDCD